MHTPVTAVYVSRELPSRRNHGDARRPAANMPLSGASDCRTRRTSWTIHSKGSTHEHGVCMANHTFPTGKTRVLGIVGDPIEQVLAPALWSELFSRNGFDLVCVPMHVRPAEPTELRRGSPGLEEPRRSHCHCSTKDSNPGVGATATSRARAVGAVNSIRSDGRGGWMGDMFDGAGFMAAYEDGIQPVRGQRVLVVGSGGVGAAIAFALGGAGARTVDVSDVDDSRARVLAERLQTQGVASRCVTKPSAEGYELVVNASPAGMRPDDPLPIDLGGATSTLAVADVVTKPADTALPRAAAELGCRVQGGLRMTEAQIPLQAAFFGFPAGEWSLSSAEGH